MKNSQPFILGFLVAATLVLLPSAHAKTKRSKNIDMEGSVVESLNKRPLESATLGEDDKNKRKHLYRKRKDFIPETRETIQQTRYNP
jgi:hypothetical protein